MHKERAGREAESSLEVREEDDPLASTGSRHHLGARSAPQDAGRHLPGADECLDGVRGDRGAPPAPTDLLRGITPGSHGVAGGKRRNREMRRRKRQESYRGCGGARAEVAGGVLECAQSKQRGLGGSFRKELQWRREQGREEPEEEDEE